jgi:hypothetical protein
MHREDERLMPHTPARRITEDELFGAPPAPMPQVEPSLAQPLPQPNDTTPAQPDPGPSRKDRPRNARPRQQQPDAVDRTMVAAASQPPPAGPDEAGEGPKPSDAPAIPPVAVLTPRPSRAIGTTVMHTFMYRPDQLEAIYALATQTSRNKSEIVRFLIDVGLAHTRLEGGPTNTAN